MSEPKEKSLGEKILTGALIYTVTHVLLGPVVGAIVTTIAAGGDSDS